MESSTWYFTVSIWTLESIHAMGASENAPIYGLITFTTK